MIPHLYELLLFSKRQNAVSTSGRKRTGFTGNVASPSTLGSGAFCFRNSTMGSTGG